MYRDNVELLSNCGGLNENASPHKLTYFNAWSLVRRTVKEGLEEVTL